MKYVENQKYDSEQVAKRLLLIRNKYQALHEKAETLEEKFKIKKDWLVAQIIWLREAELIRNDIYRDFRLL